MTFLALPCGFIMKTIVMQYKLAPGELNHDISPLERPHALKVSSYVMKWTGDWLFPYYTS